MHWIVILALGGAAFFLIKKVKEDRDELLREAAKLDKEIAEARRKVDEEKARRGVE